MQKTILRFLAGLLTFGAVVAQAEPGEPVAEITITTDKMQFLFDIKEFTAKAGSKVKLTLVVPADAVPQPHNLVLVSPGKEAALVQAAMGMMADPTAMQKGYIPELEVIVAHTKLLNPGETETIEFEVPAETGEYPYVCTFPGHFTIMKGKMHVVE